MSNYLEVETNIVKRESLKTILKVNLSFNHYEIIIHCDLISLLCIVLTLL